MAKMLYQAVALFFFLLTISLASIDEINTDLNANGAFADLITVKASYFRSLCDANPLTWDQGLADIANSTIWSCNLQYDVCALWVDSKHNADLRYSTGLHKDKSSSRW